MTLSFSQLSVGCGLWAALTLLVPCAASAAEPYSATFELNGLYEDWSLMQGESVGVAGVGVSSRISDSLSLGMESYGAIRGKLGGFITIGGVAGLRRPLAPRLWLESSLFVGAGGGRGGGRLVGGGLMLREQLGLRYAVGELGTLSAGLSRVDFPDGGVIGSTQVYLGVSRSFTALLQSGEPVYGGSLPSGFDLSAYAPLGQEMGVVVREVGVDAGVAMDMGRAQRDFSLVGVEWRTALGPHSFIRVETSAAMRGNVAGYMQVMGGAGGQFALAQGLSLHGSASLGYGGGGAVSTGGGLMAEAGLGLTYQPLARWAVDVGAGRLLALDGDLRATTYTLRVAHVLEAAPGLRNAAGTTEEALPYQAWPVRVRFAEQHYVGGSSNWRSLPAHSVGNIGFQFDYFLTRRWFLTGQGLGAYTGKAGSYMTGQLGVGTRRTVGAQGFVELEALTGAAGGGGLRTGSGLVFQTNVSVGWQLNQALSVLVTGGQMKAVNGPLRVEVAGMSVAYRFNALRVVSDFSFD